MHFFRNKRPPNHNRVPLFSSPKNCPKSTKEHLFIKIMYKIPTKPINNKLTINVVKFHQNSLTINNYFFLNYPKYYENAHMYNELYMHIT